MIRKETAQEYIDRVNARHAGYAKPLGKKLGKVLWYDEHDYQGIIMDTEGVKYTFSKGRDGHIGVSTPSGLKYGDVKANDIVKFEGVETFRSYIAFEIEI